ncbi:MAG: hypothetical protein FWG63_00685 [Defluviitaleaceae bacterium]|nr:hypothetical protein [Defluviitaleaceae bacterium]
MIDLACERLFDSIGNIEDEFLVEAQSISLLETRQDKRKKMIKYGAAAVPIMAITYWYYSKWVKGA